MHREQIVKSVLTSGTLKMPVLGLGTYNSGIEEALDYALELGYRHFDTAFSYQSEESIGNTLQKWFESGKLKREDVFISTKLALTATNPELIQQSIDKSLGRLKLDYVDLLLIHVPTGLLPRGDEVFPGGDNGKYLVDKSSDIVAIFKELEVQKDAGRTKAIGVSNFNLEQIERIIDNCGVTPSSNQIELNVYFQQAELVKQCQDLGMVVTAFCPLRFGVRAGLIKDTKVLSPLDDPTVAEIAKNHDRLPSQVMLRFLLQLGVAVIPRSTNKERLQQNMNIFDFELSHDEMEQLRALDKGKEGRFYLMLEFSEHPEYNF